MGFTSLEGDVRRRWKRVAQLAIDSDELRSLRLAIALVCEAPQDSDARERMRAIATEHRAFEQLAPLLAAEVRMTRDPDVVAALDEESARARSQIEFPPPPMPALRESIEREPDNPEHLEMLAWSYYLAGVWTKAAETLEELAAKVPPEHAILPLHAAARLYRNTGHSTKAQTTYRAIVVLKPSNTEALIAISELVSDQPALNHTSPFDPPVTDEVLESSVVMADVAARTQTEDVVAPPAEPAPAPEPPKRRKRMQVFDRIDEAELDARFASVFDEGEPRPEPEDEPEDEPEPEPEPRPEASEPEIQVVPPADSRPIAVIKLQTARVPRLHADGTPVRPRAGTPPPVTEVDSRPASRPRASTPHPISESSERSAPLRPIPRAAMPVPRASTPIPIARTEDDPAVSRVITEPPPPPLPRAATPPPIPPPRAATPPPIPRAHPRAATPPPIPAAARKEPSKQIVAVDELAVDPPAKAIELAIDVAIGQAQDVMGEADLTPPPPPDESLATTDAALGDALDVAFDHATDKARNGKPEAIAIPRQITREPSAGVASPEAQREIDAARADARAGRVGAAEQRLHALIVVRPLETHAHLALVDLWRTNGRLDDADRFLCDAIAGAPADASMHRAALLHRHALVTVVRGDREQAHAMLREAHELEPMSLPITLALGESYFAREAWGEASRHLGPLAGHPDVASHPRAAARGLVIAALAEIRLERPNQATALYQAALRIDPSCEAARQALKAE